MKIDWCRGITERGSDRDDVLKIMKPQIGSELRMNSGRRLLSHPTNSTDESPILSDLDQLRDEAH